MGELIYLRAERERQKLTQELLEDASGVPQNTISRLERDPNANPSFGTVTKLATALKVDPAALRFGPVPGEAVSR